MVVLVGAFLFVLGLLLGVLWSQREKKQVFKPLQSETMIDRGVKELKGSGWDSSDDIPGVISRKKRRNAEDNAVALELRRQKKFGDLREKRGGD